MKTLNAIADVHVDNVLGLALECGVGGDVSEIHDKTKPLVTQMCNNPLLVLGKGFSRDFLGFIYKNRFDLESFNFAKEMYHMGRDILRREINEISKGYKTVYCEGDTYSLPAKAALIMGLGVIKIDKDVRKSYTERESDWVEVISSTSTLEKSLLLAGGAHLRNEFGLIDKFAGREIRLNIVLNNDKSYGNIKILAGQYKDHLHRLIAQIKKKAK